MVTVYSRLQQYSVAKKFTFPSKHKMIIGALVAKRYRETEGSTETLPMIVSNEYDPHNTIPVYYTVFAYPLEFTTEIDNIIDDYVQRLITSGKKKKTNEKPLIKTDPARPISYSSDPPKKERKRKPIQPQPHFSGKLLKKK